MLLLEDVVAAWLVIAAIDNTVATVIFVNIDREEVIFLSPEKSSY
jgi:hypothetical protein